MRGSWVRAVAACALVTALLLSGSAATAAGGTTTTTPRTATTATSLAAVEQVLGVVSADGGSRSGTQLTLTGVQPQFTWFTDRPAREAGLLPVGDLADVFFARELPPNAALVIQGAPPARDVAVLELSKPRYDTTTGTLRFTTKQLTPDDSFRAIHASLAQFADRADTKIPTKFGASSLFVDTAPAVTLTPDQQQVDQLVDQWNSLQRTWGSAFTWVKNCIDSTKNQNYFQVQEWLVVNYKTILPGGQELILQIQPSVNQTGTLTAAEQQQLAQIQNAFAQEQQNTDQLPALVQNKCVA